MAGAESRRIRLGELLLRAGVITEEQLRAALAEQKKWGGKLGSVLVDMNFLDEDMLVKALSKQLGLPRVDFGGLVISTEALEKLDSGYAEQNQVLPISLDVGRGILMVAMADPANLGLADEIAFRTGCRVKVAIAGERSLAQAIRENFFSDRLPSDEPIQIQDGMKLLDSQGSTMVRRLDEIKAADRPAAAPPAAPPSPASKPVEAPREQAAPLTIDERLQRLEALQHQEVRVLKTIVELLIAKGFITREEYRQKVE